MLTQKIALKVIKLENTTIYDQLKLEEYLLRDCQDNICVINFGTSPAIVMGISGKVEELVHIDQARELDIPIIKRFSGGGTVIVDEDTLFITFIFNSQDVLVPCFPEPIYQFSEIIYKKVFEGLPFELKQNDYVFHDRKIGGNAQYIKKDRWLHHTSFLWDYKPSNMALLKHPKKTPIYRQNRSHNEFITSLIGHFKSKQDLVHQIEASLNSLFYIEALHHDLLKNQASRSSTHYLDLQLLEIR